MFACTSLSVVPFSFSFIHATFSFIHATFSCIYVSFTTPIPISFPSHFLQTNTTKVLLKITHIYTSPFLRTHTLHFHVLRTVHKRDVCLLQIRHIYTSPQFHFSTLKHGTNRVMKRPTPLSFGSQRSEVGQVYSITLPAERDVA